MVSISRLSRNYILLPLIAEFTIGGVTSENTRRILWRTEQLQSSGVLTLCQGYSFEVPVFSVLLYVL